MIYQNQKSHKILTKLAFLNLCSRVLLIYLGLMLIKRLKRSGYISSLFTYLPALLLFVTLFGISTHGLNQVFQFPEGSEFIHLFDSALLYLLILIKDNYNLFCRK